MLVFSLSTSWFVGRIDAPFPHKARVVAVPTQERGVAVETLLNLWVKEKIGEQIR